MAGEPENQRITRLTPLDDVLASIKAIAPVAPRAVDLSRALYRALAEDVAATVGQPAGPRALRDGYAVRADDIADAGSYAPVPLTVAPVRVDVGEALPPGADAVVPLDAVVSRGGRFEVVAPATSGDGVLPGGADLHAGDFIARAGWRLNDFNLAMLAMAGSKQVLVREPRIRLVKARTDADVVLDAVGDLLVRASNARGCAVRRSAGDLAGALVDAADDVVIAIGGTGSGRNDTSVQIARQARPRGGARHCDFAGRDGGLRHERQPRRCCCCPGGSMPPSQDGSQWDCRWSTAWPAAAKAAIRRRRFRSHVRLRQPSGSSKSFRYVWRRATPSP